MGQVQSHAAAEAEAVEETPSSSSSSSSSSLESLIAGILPLFLFMSKNFCLWCVWELFMYDLLFIYPCLSVQEMMVFASLWKFHCGICSAVGVVIASVIASFKLNRLLVLMGLNLIDADVSSSSMFWCCECWVIGFSLSIVSAMVIMGTLKNLQTTRMMNQWRPCLLNSSTS